MENGEKKNGKKGSKKEKIKIDRTDNVMYKLEKYYSALQGKTYIAKLPESLQGTEFGPEIKALVASLYYENRVTENKIASFLNSNGLLISEGTVSNIGTCKKTRG